jgi:hypothetical protein
MWNGLSQGTQSFLIGAGVGLILDFVYSNRVELKRIVADGLVLLEGFSILYVARVIMRVVRFLKIGAYRHIFCKLCICLLIVVAFDPDPEMAILRAQIRRDIRQGMNVIRQGMIAIRQAVNRIRRDGRAELLGTIITLVFLAALLYDGYHFVAYIMTCIDEFLCTHVNRIDADIGKTMLVETMCPS